jgi:AcrR family transcriptional regulator
VTSPAPGAAPPPPGTRPRRRLHPDERRDELLAAAVELLRDRGPAHTRVQDVTTAAGTAKGNFYRYFDSIDDLLVAVRDRLLDDYYVALAQRRAADPDPDWWRVLEEETRRFLSFHLDLGPLHDVLFHGPAAEGAPIPPERNAGHAIATLLEAARAAGAVDVDDLETVGELVFHTVHGAADTIRAGADRRRVEDALIEMLRRALGAGARRTGVAHPPPGG